MTSQKQSINLALMEDQNAKLEAVLDLLGEMPKLKDLQRLEAHVDELQADVRVTELAVCGVSGELVKLDTRVSTPEAA